MDSVLSRSGLLNYSNEYPVYVADVHFLDPDLLFSESNGDLILAHPTWLQMDSKAPYYIQVERYGSLPNHSRSFYLELSIVTYPEFSVKYDPPFLFRIVIECVNGNYEILLQD